MRFVVKDLRFGTWGGRVEEWGLGLGIWDLWAMGQGMGVGGRDLGMKVCVEGSGFRGKNASQKMRWAASCRRAAVERMWQMSDVRQSTPLPSLRLQVQVQRYSLLARRRGCRGRHPTLPSEEGIPYKISTTCT